MGSKSVSEWADELAALNLIVLFIVLFVMRFTTLVICQEKCPYFLMNFKAAFSGVPNRNSTKKQMKKKQTTKKTN